MYAKRYLSHLKFKVIKEILNIENVFLLQFINYNDIKYSYIYPNFNEKEE